MECGKTTVICKLVKALSRATGLRVACGKVTGVACQRDCMRIADSGAFMSLDITDAGLPSTCGPAPTTVAAALGCIAALNEAQPDCILLEFGDGLLGRYNVDALLHRQEIMKHMVLLGIVSGDLVGTKGGIDLLRNEFHYQGPLFVTGQTRPTIQLHQTLPAMSPAMRPALADLFTVQLMPCLCPFLARSRPSGVELSSSGEGFQYGLQCLS